MIGIGVALGLGRGRGQITPITPPLDWTFSASDWTLTPDDGDPRITITGAAGDFDDVLYSVNGGSWISTGIDSVDEGITLGVALPVSVAIRPVLDGVRGPGSSPKTAATPSFTAPPGFSTSTPYEGEPLTLDGGAPTTDYTELAVIDCGGPTITTTVRTIDGRVEGDLP